MTWQNTPQLVQPYWRDNDNWVCPNHLPSAKIPSHIEKCWYCNAPRPVSEHNNVIYLPLCEFELCKQGPSGTKGVAHGNSKYCRPECRRQRARLKYNNKMKRKKDGDT